MPGGLSNDLRSRLSAHWRIKLLLLIGLTTAFTAPYIYLAHHPLTRLHQVPMTWLDRAAGFEPRWVWVYQSLYLLTGSLPWFAQTRRQLRNYVIGFALLSAASFAVFIFFPTRCPRVASPNASGMYKALLAYDGPFNAMPSMHVGILFYTLCFAGRVAAPISRFGWIVLLTWFWLIAWSTLALKEHYALDLVAGVALAWLADGAAWSRQLRIRGTMSQAG